LNSRTHEDDRALVLAEVLNAMDITEVPMSEDVREFLAARHAKRTAAEGIARRKSPGNDTRHGPGLRKPRLGRGAY
jgi:hypothetical protein